jgi:hypothetical protein
MHIENKTLRMHNRFIKMECNLQLADRQKGAYPLQALVTSVKSRKII